MVNKVVPLDELVPATMEMAGRIAKADAFALRMAKRAVNHTLDVQGYSTAIDCVLRHASLRPHPGAGDHRGDAGAEPACRR